MYYYIAKSDGTREVLVAGGNAEDFYPNGRDETFLYNLDGGYWRPGPQLPTNRAWGAGVR